MDSPQDVRMSMIGKFGYVNTDLFGPDIWHYISSTKTFNKYARKMNRILGGINF